MAFAPFTEINDNVADAGDLISVEAFQVIANNINALIDSMPPGTIIPILTGFTGVPTPNPLLWQLCDGAPITNPDSPLRGQNTPDYVDPAAGPIGGGRYMRGYINAGTIGNYGGTNQGNFAHSHGDGGFTQDKSTPVANSDSDNDFMSVLGHKHSIPVGLTQLIDMQPPYICVHHYIKIF